MEVVLDSAAAQEQFGRDVRVADPSAGEQRDSHLLRRELVEGGRVLRAPARCLAAGAELGTSATRAGSPSSWPRAGPEPDRPARELFREEVPRPPRAQARSVVAQKAQGSRSSVIVVPRAEQQHNALGLQPARHKNQRVGRWPVKPLRVIDKTEEALAGRHLRNKGKDRDRDQKGSSLRPGVSRMWSSARRGWSWCATAAAGRRPDPASASAPETNSRQTVRRRGPCSSSAGDAGGAIGGVEQRLILQLQFPQPRPFRQFQRWLVRGMRLPVGPRPIPQAGFTQPQLAGHLGNSPRPVHNHPRRFFANLRRMLLLFR